LVGGRAEGRETEQDDEEGTPAKEAEDAAAQEDVEGKRIGGLHGREECGGRVHFSKSKAKLSNVA